MRSGIVFNVQRFCINDGVGLRTSVFLKGCPLHCKWCHNPESICKDIEVINNDEIGHRITSKELFDIIKKDIIYYQKSNGGVTFTGGEPLLQSDFVIEVARMCKKNNISTAIETSGFVNQKDLIKTMKYIDYVLFDIKTFDETTMKENIGGNLNLILSNIKILNHLNKKIILRCPIIPNINLNKEHFIKLADLSNSYSNIIMVNFLKYHRLGKAKCDKYGYQFNDFGTLNNDLYLSLINNFKELCIKEVVYE